MSPLSFIKRPAVWIELISQYRATHIQAPNFGFQLVARKWKALAAPPRVDLSSLRHAFNAAEPINPVSIQEFCHTFAPYGFSASAMKPGYGLAEHCVYVSDGGTCVLRVHRREFEEGRISINAEFKLEDLQTMPAERSSSTTLDFVSCGPVFPHASKNSDIWLQLVDPATSVLVDPHNIGEVWISSPSVAQGYWGQADLTRDTFHARAVSTTTTGTTPDSRRYLRTGDLAFLHKGELYICGRAKDLIILRGKNYFPQVCCFSTNYHLT
jgi:acyl-CoA synthetase (AMP-forming)/AMP-acid ligase II